MKKHSIALISLLILLTNSSFAEAPFEAFLQSVDQHLMISTDRMLGSIQGVHLAQPSLLERWGYINTDAAAAYNSLINTVVLKPEYTVAKNEGLGFRMKTWGEMQSEPGLSAADLAAVTFHELSHAEYQKMQKSPYTEDRNLAHLLKIDLVEHLRDQGVGLWSSWLAASEYFAYFREDAFRLIASEIETVLYSNGVLPTRGTCLSGPGHRRRWEKVPPAEHGKFQLFDADKIFSENDIAPTSIIRGGKNIPLNATIEPLKGIHHAVWAQMLNEFHLPTSRKALVAKMNSSLYRQQLLRCNY